MPQHTTRLSVIRIASALVLALALTQGARAAPPPPPATYTQTPLAPGAIPQFVQQLPQLSLSATYAGGLQTVAAGTDPITLRMCEFDASVLPPGALGKGTPAPLTRVWGYAVGSCPAPGAAPRDSYIGPVLAVSRGTPAQVTFVNDLGHSDTTGVIAWRTSTDQTLHWADPINLGANACMAASMANPMTLPTGVCAKTYSGPIPAVPHLHGGEVPPVLDGGPDAWFTSDGAYHGATYYTRPGSEGLTNAAVYRYPNVQEPAPLWFHDHTLGATRLNVYAGLAGGYVLSDPGVSEPSLPPVTEIVPLVLQDRMFDTTGQLLFEAGVSGGVLWALNPEHPYWSPEFVGDTIVVNGKAWPNLNVEPRRYRFLFLDGSNARTYAMSLVNRATKLPGPNLWVIATDGGFLDFPALVDTVGLNQKLLIMPGERYEAIIDFSGLAPGTQLFLNNQAKTPYPGGAAPQGSTTGRIMQFTVTACASGRCGAGDTSYDPALGGSLRQPGKGLVKLVNFLTGTTQPGVQPSLVRQLTLNEVMGMMPMTFTTGLYTGSSVTSTAPITVTYPGGPMEILLNNSKWVAATTETPAEGATEIWEIVNLTADAHPIHLHLVQFQILNRQPFDAKGYAAAYALAFPGGVFAPGSGPPLPYASGGVKAVPGVAAPATIPYVGGNPDVTLFLKGAAAPPAIYEAGWKDTAMALPGSVTRLAVRWAPTDRPVGTGGTALAFPFDPSAMGRGYVWHCHIIDHEDNEMMRRTSVSPLVAESARGYRLGIDY